MRINTNISALKANNCLTKTNNALSKSLERLSSGYRINRAADDAAGMAIAQKMKTQIAGLDQANRNASDGISLIQTAEGALVEVNSMLQRMRELAVQAANATNTDTDRESIQAEINQLNGEVQRISETTEFNTLSLLDGSADRKSFSDTPSVQLIGASDAVGVGDYSIKITQDARQAVVSGMKMEDLAALPNGKITSEYAGTINVNGIDISIEEGDTVNAVFEKIRSGCEKANINVISSDGTKVATPTEENAATAQYNTTPLSGASELVFITKEYGADQSIEIRSDNSKLCGLLSLSSAGVKASGHDVKAEINYTTSDFSDTATVSTKGNQITVTDQSGFEMTLEAEVLGTAFVDQGADGTPASIDTTKPAVDQDVTVTVLAAGSLKLQVGANEGQIVEVTIPKVDPVTLGIINCNLCTSDGAQKAITVYDNAVTRVSSIRAKLGAYQNRLEHSVSNLGVSGENMTEALSRIEDVDMAAEMATYTQKNVLAQAGTSMLAQANQRPQNILSLLNA